MKTIKILLLLCCCSSTGIAQSNGVSFSINDSNSGTGLNFNYIKKIKERISFGGGVRIHLNPKIKFNSGIPLDHTFYAQNFSQRLGLNAFFEYQFKIKDWKIDPFLGYHSQIFKSARQIVLGLSTESILFESESPLTVWNNMLAFGLNYDLSNKLSLKGHTGLGFSSFYNVDHPNLSTNGTPNKYNTWQGNMSFKIGVVYWLTTSS